jgi:hypothetical protein
MFFLTTRRFHRRVVVILSVAKDLLSITNRTGIDVGTADPLRFALRMTTRFTRTMT